MKSEKNTACWIWYPGDFEIYHSMLLHGRRQQHGFDYPPFWHIPRPEHHIRFSRSFSVPCDTDINVCVKGKGYLISDGMMTRTDTVLHYAAGEHTLLAMIENIGTFPALYIDSPYLKTGVGWVCERLDGELPRPAAYDPVFPSPDDDPAVFPFAYEDIPVCAEEEIPGGVLYDFGRENFGPVTVRRTEDMGEILIVYGESRGEALDPENAILWERLPAGAGEITLVPRAFRYLGVTAEKGKPEISAKLEYVPFPDLASFSCDDPEIAGIWEICARTFHLCSREFYLDGIKRDRWVWSGDAYQAFTVNPYFCFEPAVIRRTIRALLGKPPVRQHVNTINDYSAYLILSVWEYYFMTGDLAFVRSVWEETKDLYAFILSRLDERTGYVVPRSGDWIFIDWGNIDTTGATCAEQILLWKAHLTMDGLSRALGEEDFAYHARADKLRAAVMRDFYDEKQGTFIDSYESGKRHISRQTHVFAILFGFVSGDMAKNIYRSVLCNDSVEPITTPYFKYYELNVRCMMGDTEMTQTYIDEYWGGMKKLGATTVWEQFDPRKTGEEHYGMYGKKYGCSLCHIWGSGPLALLGRYVAGVKATDIAYRSFEVAPCPGKYRQFDAVVPVKDGSVKVSYHDGTVRVFSDVPGGTLRFGGKSIPIPAGTEVTLDR